MNKQLCINIVPNVLILKLTGIVSMAEDVKETIRLRKFGFVRYNQHTLSLLN